MVVGDIRSALRSATAPLHDDIDAQFSRFDLGQRDGLTRFLVAHAIAMRACQPRLTRFARAALGATAPDYLNMLKRDLTGLGIAATHLPRVMLPDAIADAGVFYVVAGSRLGVAVLRARATAIIPGGTAAQVCSYFAKGQGPAMWRLFQQWLAAGAQQGEIGEPVTSLAMSEAATATFHLFAHAAKLATGTPLATGAPLVSGTRHPAAAARRERGDSACP